MCIIYLFVYLFMYLFIYLFIYLCIYVFMYLFIYVFIYVFNLFGGGGGNVNYELQCIIPKGLKKLFGLETLMEQNSWAYMML